MTQSSTLKTFLWYNSGLHDALTFYKEIFGADMRIDDETLFNENLFTASFAILGHELIAMNTPGGESFNSSISLSVQVDGQSEVDRIWDAIAANGAPGRCGWCTDKWGVNWQVKPYQMQEFLGHPDQAKAQQNMGIMMTMGKIELSKFVQ